MGRFGIFSDDDDDLKQQSFQTTSYQSLAFIKAVRQQISQSSLKARRGLDTQTEEEPISSSNGQSSAHVSLLNELEMQRKQFESLCVTRKQKLNSVLSKFVQQNQSMAADLKESVEKVRQMELQWEKEELKRDELAKAALKAKQEKEAELKAKQDAELKARQIQKEADEKEIQKKNDQLKLLEAQKQQSAAKNIPHIVSKDAWESACQYLETLKKIKTVSRVAINASPDSRNKLFKYKMSITQKIGQITRSQKKLIEVSRVLDGNMADAKTVSDNLYLVVMDLTAKQIIRQAEKEVSVKRNMAFPLALICILLFKKHTEFQGILLGRFMKRCPYITPRYILKLEDESMQDYSKRLRYKEVDENVLETEIQYGERMAGILALYAAIIQTTTIPNTYGISNGWTWLARILNMNPRRITSLLLTTFLEVAGNQFLKTYKKQGLKVIRYIVEELIPLMPQASNASNTRLKLFLEETVLKNEMFPVFEGSQLEP